MTIHVINIETSLFASTVHIAGVHGAMFSVSLDLLLDDATGGSNARLSFDIVGGTAPHRFAVADLAGIDTTRFFAPGKMRGALAEKEKLVRALTGLADKNLSV